MSNLFENCSNYLFKNKHILLLLFLLPPLLWLGIIYLGSLIVFLFHSFFYLDGFTGKIVYKISLRTIAELFNSPANLDILIRTVVLAATVSIGAAIIGFPIAYYMAKFTSPKMKIFFYLAIMLPLWSSYLVRVYSWKLILAKEGIINWVFAKLHATWIIDSILSIPLIGGPSLSISYIGMFLVFTYIWLPFMILPIQAALERVPGSLINASYDLGATKRQTFYKVILPLALPGIAAGSIFTFSLTLGDYIIPYIIGTSKFFIGQAVYTHFQGTAGNIPLAAAFSLVPIAVMTVYIYVAKKLGAFNAL
jgi:putative spermidine/putrescine transport system permease protein